MSFHLKLDKLAPNDTVLPVPREVYLRGQDARTTIFSPFTLYIISPKYAVSHTILFLFHLLKNYYKTDYFR